MMAPEILTKKVRDGYPLVTRVWQSTHASIRVIVIHGIVSHSGWYMRSCQYLAEQGYEVHALDRRGSGMNFQDRGDATTVFQWLDDFEDYMNGLNPTLPTVVLGISWGGKLAALLASRPSRHIVGSGLICPGIYAYQQVAMAKQWFIRAASKAGLGTLRVPIPLADPALFTNSSFYQTYIRDDPFTLRRVTIRFAAADLELNRMVRSCAHQIQIPMFLMLAGQERIVDNQRTLEFWNNVTSPIKELVEYPQAAHTLEFEADPSQYLNDLANCVRRLLRSENDY
jgi:alpha-beta hydrolase superfamily lysophospholipase